MSSRSTRISTAIDSLVRRFQVDIPGEDPADAEERESNATDFVREILGSSKTPAVVADVNQASDLIKKRLIQTNPSPNEALRFTNLYSRLLSIPVITQKWAVLYFLYQLGDQEQLRPSGLTSPFMSPVNKKKSKRPVEDQDTASAAPLRDTRRNIQTDGTFDSQSQTSREEREFDDAFAPAGLRKLPEREGGQRDRKEEEQVFVKTPGSQRESVALKTALLAENYVEIDPPETALLRDLPFTLQGLSSSNLPFDSQSSLRLPDTLPVPIISILHTLAEPSLLYRSLSGFVQTSDGGLLGQSLRAAIAGELRSYLGLVATLEGQIRRALSSLDESEPRGGVGKAGVTLKRCVVWTREATMGLRLMSLISEESKSKKGGQLITLIHGFSSSHGDPMVGAFAERLLIHVTRPFYDMLRHWIYDGELSDPYHEFFVSEQDPNAIQEAQDGRSRGGASSVWEDKYKLNENMVPSIITQDFAQKVFLIGKSLNFIRYGCGDSQWVEEYSKDASKELRYGDTATLETWIDEAYKTTMARLIHLMSEKFHLFEHLKALKNYILLGQGDFIALLMESLASNLDRPAGAQYRHTLTAQLEHAIRGSNAQYDSPEVLRRLDARMLQLSHGDIGWDCFTLEYKIDAPVDVVVTEWGNRQYLKVFNFLWRIKRVEFALSTTWRKCMTGARGVLLGSPDPAFHQSWKQTRGVLAEMIHFIAQLQYYILFEVIESSWDELQSAIHKDGCTLDDLIKAHTKYLNAITHKGLLGAKKKHSNDLDDNTFMVQLGEILRLMLSYRDAVDGLYSFSVTEYSKRQNANSPSIPRPGTSTSSRPGTRFDDYPPARSPFENPNPALLNLNLSNIQGEEEEFPLLAERLSGLGTQFKTRISLLLGDLAYQPDTDMRFLGVVMNFNDVYTGVRRKSARERERERDKGKGKGREGRSGESSARER
ncbi:Bcspc98 [Botrytis cinerea B05.10]|uniref:Bcspc98 n=3 Tax=Botryotinia fuckeliana TaxID=40559 RepID=A0A384JSA8_BOTFB|nr:Bcspc98 [Botrytis cinerea B05.10]ATZ53476.1 Bcspc98 [Botrytis cinerea B05.10]EMR90541.1 putative spc97 spc98 family protein [Botrytis cinerea BcDW1]CCD44577.1 similar to spindle pole body component alp6 [Botrytis cinerea T4]